MKIDKMRKISLSSTPFYAASAVVIMLGIMMTTVFAINEYNAFNQHIQNIKTQFQEQYKERLKEEVDKVINYIVEHNQQSNLQIEKELRQKVQSAYTITSHVHDIYATELNNEKLQQMILELLRPIRWSDDNGFYFIANIKTNRFELFANNPAIEGHNLSTIFNEQSGKQAEELLSSLYEKDTDFFEYATQKPGFPQTMLIKAVFARYFAPFDWIIGAEVYKKGIEEMLQAELLNRIRMMHFGIDGNFFIFRKDGTIITHSNTNFIGRSLTDISDESGNQYGKKLLEAGLSTTNGEYIELTNIADNQQQNRLFFVKPYSSWGWIICANISMNELNKAISSQTVVYRMILTKNIILFLLLLGIAVIILLFASYFYSFKIRNNIDQFTMFFKKAVNEKIKIQESDMIFNEFVELSHLANDMVDDLALYEWHKKQDEIRLSTLLELANTHMHSPQDYYKFTVNKIIQLTNSEAGYLAIPNDDLQTLSIILLAYDQSYEYTCHIDEDNLPSTVIKSNETIICNDSEHCTHNLSPYRQHTHRHLDIPFYHEGKIVLLAGVCNGTQDYETSDVRQISLILNGLWLQMLRMRAETEMLALERQIIAVSEQERSNIGKDLHDNLCSHLSGVELLTKALAQKAGQECSTLAEQLETIRRFIKEAVEKARQLAHGLYPVHIAEEGIEAAIKALTLEIQQLFHINCTYTFHGHIKWADNNMPTQIYCIVREAVFNAAKHAEAQNIHIECRSKAGLLELMVRDDGKGFDTSLRYKGLGLHTMRYRAKAIGAVLKITSEAGKGTQVSILTEMLSSNLRNNPQE